jgi:hypothetical protein
VCGSSAAAASAAKRGRSLQPARVGQTYVPEGFLALDAAVAAGLVGKVRDVGRAAARALGALVCCVAPPGRDRAAVMRPCVAEDVRAAAPAVCGGVRWCRRWDAFAAVESAEKAARTVFLAARGAVARRFALRW